MQVVKLRAFLEDWCFRRVQVLRFAVAEDTPTKGNYPALVIMNWEDDPRTEAVIKLAIIFARDQSGLRHQV